MSLSKQVPPNKPKISVNNIDFEITDVDKKEIVSESPSPSARREQSILIE